MRDIVILVVSREPERVQALLERRYPGILVTCQGPQMTIAIPQSVQQTKPEGELERMLAEGAFESCAVEDWRIIAA